MKKIWEQILRYFYIKKKDPDVKQTTELKVMNFMNRIAILTFLVALVLLILKLRKYFS